VIGGLSRADFHSQNLERAREEALRLFNARAELQGAELGGSADLHLAACGIRQHGQTRAAKLAGKV